MLFKRILSVVAQTAERVLFKKERRPIKKWKGRKLPRRRRGRPLIFQTPKRDLFQNRAFHSSKVRREQDPIVEPVLVEKSHTFNESIFKTEEGFSPQQPGVTSELRLDSHTIEIGFNAPDCGVPFTSQTMENETPRSCALNPIPLVIESIIDSDIKLACSDKNPSPGLDLDSLKAFDFSNMNGPPSSFLSHALYDLSHRSKRKSTSHSRHRLKNGKRRLSHKNLCQDLHLESITEQSSSSVQPEDDTGSITKKLKASHDFATRRRSRPYQKVTPVVQDDPYYESTLRFLNNYTWVEEDIPIVTERFTQLVNELYTIYDQLGADVLHRYIFKDKNSTNNKEGKDENESKAFLKVQGDARKYQTLMAEIAKQRNSIITLGTGQGKTLIAMMTIRHFRTMFPKKQTWFLVPTVALATQQADTLKINLPYTVKVASSDCVDTKRSREDLRKADILVATHGSALNLLRHYGDQFYLSRVNLLVLDECHNATKQHNYAVIMDTFYHTISDTHRPHILGLTASPIINIKNEVNDTILEEMLCNLEKKLDANLISLTSLGIPPEESGVIENMVEERVVKYQNNFVPIEDQLPDPSKSNMHEDRVGEAEQLRFLYEEFGPLLVERYCRVLVEELSRNRFDEETTEQFDELINYLKAVIDHCMKMLQDGREAVSEKLRALEDLLSELFTGSSAENESIGMLFVDRRITAVALKNYFSFGISQKQSSPHSTSKLQLKCDLLTAGTTSIFKSTSVTQSRQNGLGNQPTHDNWLHISTDARTILNRLRRKELDLLISTSLVEEGVDVAACSFVIVLDDLKTTKSYIQYKGRARQFSAKFVVFEDVNNPPIITMDHARTMESYVKTYIGRRALTKPITSAIAAEPTPTQTSQPITSAEETALIAGEYRTPLASADLVCAKNIVNRYALSIPRDISARSSRNAMKPYLPVYNDDTLLLPTHLPNNIRLITLPEAYKSSNKLENESKMALIASVRLHMSEALNDRLLPLSRDDMTQVLMNLVTPLRLSIMQSLPVTSADVAASTRVGYIYPILYESRTFESYDTLLRGEGRTLGLFSFRPLNGPFVKSLRHGLFGEILCRFDECRQEPVNKAEYYICTLFYEFIFNARWRKRSSHKRLRFVENNPDSQETFPSYIVVPLTKDKRLDFDRMRTAIEEYLRSDEERQEAASSFEDGDAPRVWTPLHEPNTYYISLNYSEINCSSPYPDTTLFRTYHQYYLKHWSVRLNRDCPLILATTMWYLPRKMTDDTWLYAEDDSTCDDVELSNTGIPSIDRALETNQLICTGPHAISARCMFLPRDGCSEAPIADASLFLHTTFLPQVLYYVERNETVCQFLDYCSKHIPALEGYLKDIPLEVISEAITAKSCSLPFNYDRLEYLGDAVLKLIQTDSLLYSTNERLTQWLKFLHEGDLSALRSAMGCNKRLKKAAEQTGIARFTLLRPLDSSQWLPSQVRAFIIKDHSEVDAKLEALPEYKPSDKVKADIIESIIGLVYVYCKDGYTAATKVAEALGIALVQDQGRRFDDRVYKNQENKFNLDLLRSVNRFLDYEMKHSTLIKEALTHPTVVHSDVPCYQRLEWIGDAVLCLAAREWLFTQFPDFTPKELVPIEHTIVSNEAFGWLGFRSDIQKYVDHCDSSFTGRFEEYSFNLKSEMGMGIWGTKPPKVIADVLEALIGAVHSEGGFLAGQQSALFVLTPITSAILRGGLKDHYSLMQPQQLVMQQVAICKIRGEEEQTYTGHDLYHGSSIGWGPPRESTFDGAVGLVTFYGVKLLAATDKGSRVVAKNRACSILSNIMLRNSDLVCKLGKLSSLLGQKDEMETDSASPDHEP